MPTYQILGIPVHFPYEAYGCQLIYMEKVIYALNNGLNALLESPTGTGKTLCLLCATLAWRESFINSQKSFAENVSTENSSPFPPQGKSSTESGEENGKVGKKATPVIFYSSRTHSQLQQVVREFKVTQYRPKMSIIGSRQQLCIHEKISEFRGEIQNIMCKNAIKFTKKKGKRECGYHQNVPRFLKFNATMGEVPFDIEDLVRIGKQNSSCPYFLSKEIAADSGILFLPYSYVISKKVQNNSSKKINKKKSDPLDSVDWENSVVIFDEAHNIESQCADASSVDISTSLLSLSILEAQKCVEIAIKKKTTDENINPDTFATLKGLLLALDKKIKEVKIDDPDRGFTRPGDYLHQFLGELHITKNTVVSLEGCLVQAIEMLSEDDEEEKREIIQLQEFLDSISKIFSDDSEEFLTSFRFHISVHTPRNTGGLSSLLPSRTMSWWCFNPGLVLKDLKKKGVRSLILTSGTLAPLSSFEKELKIPFPVQLENPHVISANQLRVAVVPRGPAGRQLNSSYLLRDSKDYKMDLGNAIVNFVRIIPGGVLVFFPSYSVMESCIEEWKTSGGLNKNSIWERIGEFKQSVIEPRQSSLFQQTKEDYKRKLHDPTSSGAIFYGVCRGKASEGLDFSDNYGRAVIITGLPFPNLVDNKVQLKREYLDEKIAHDPQSLSGSSWYSLQASRAVNQAVGRVLRHRHDYGVVLLCDDRYSNPRTQQQLSFWLRPHLKTFSKFGEVIPTINNFFKDKQKDPKFRMDKKIKEELSPSPSSALRPSFSTLKGPDGIKEEPSPTVSTMNIPALLSQQNYNPFNIETDLSYEKLSSLLCGSSRREKSKKKVSSSTERNSFPSQDFCEGVSTSETIFSQNVSQSGENNSSEEFIIFPANKLVGSSSVNFFSQNTNSPSNFGVVGSSSSKISRKEKVFIAAPEHVLERLRKKAENGAVLGTGIMGSRGREREREGEGGREEAREREGEGGRKEAREREGEGGRKEAREREGNNALEKKETETLSQTEVPGAPRKSTKKEEFCGGIKFPSKLKKEENSFLQKARGGEREERERGGCKKPRVEEEKEASVARVVEKEICVEEKGNELVKGKIGEMEEKSLGKEREGEGDAEGVTGKIGRGGVGSGTTRKDTGKGNLARAYVQDVKDEMSVQDYREFVGEIHKYKTGTISVETLLSKLAEIFRQPNHFTLLQRFGLFLKDEDKGFLSAHLERHRGIPY